MFLRGWGRGKGIGRNGLGRRMRGEEGGGGGGGGRGGGGASSSG